MSISIQCGSCQSQFNVDDRLAGKKVKCKQCGAPIGVPMKEPAEVLELEAPDPYSQPIAPAPPPSAAASRSGRRVNINRCPSCTAILSEGAMICTLCGMNLQTGKKEHVENFLEIPLSGEGSDDRPKKQWFRKRGNPMLESLDEILKLVLILMAVAGTVVWIWHLYKTPTGISIVSLLPLGVVTAILVGVIAPVAAFAVKTTVGLLKYIPRLDTYLRIALTLMLPFAASLIAGFPGQEQNLAFLPPLCWFLSVVLMIYFLRADLMEWLVSATVALAAIALTWLLAAGILTSAGRSAPLYAAMLPGAPWSSFMPLQDPPPPENKPAVADAGTTNNGTSTQPGTGATTTPPTMTANNTTPVTNTNNNANPTRTEATAAVSSMDTHATTPANATGTNNVNVTPVTPVAAVTSPLLTNIQSDIAGLKGINDIVTSRVTSNYFLVTRVADGKLIAERWTVSPLEKKNEALVDYVPGKKAPQLALSSSGANLVVLHFFPANKIELINMEGKAPRKNVSMSDMQSTPTLLGFIDQARFVLRLDLNFQSGLQIRNAIDGAVARNLQPAESMAPGTANIALSTIGRYAAIGRDHRISVYTLDNNTPTTQFAPTTLAFRVLNLSCSPDGTQLAMFAIVQDTPTVLSFKAQRGDSVATSVIATAHQPAVNIADPEVEGGLCGNDLLWLQNGATWLIAGTKLIESSTGREIGTIDAPGITNQYHVGNGQLIFVSPSPTGTGFDGIAARLDDAKVKATLEKIR